ncbi:MAG TPA: POTRA domain-containing protein, partial [Bryobacteraceae bacterium]
MKQVRPLRLVLGSVWICAWITGSLAAQQQAPAPSPQQPPAGQANPPAQPGTPQQRPPNPFENVPEPGRAPAQGQQQAPPAQTPQLEAPKPAPTVANPAPRPPGGQQAIEAIEFRGARRVPQDTLRALIYSKAGDIYNEETLRRDLTALWNTGRFDDITVETEQGKTGIIVRFVVVERRVIRSIDYQGIHSVTVSEILDRFKERRVGLTVESQYDPNKVQRAAVV